jgi:hypothetical protein
MNCIIERNLNYREGKFQNCVLPVFSFKKDMLDSIFPRVYEQSAGEKIRCRSAHDTERENLFPY